MRLTIAALLLSGSLLLAGCGGGEESPSASATPDPGDEKAWAGKVTDVCKQSQKAAEKAAADAQAQGLEGRALVAEVLEQSVPAQRDLVENLDAIEAPEDIQDDYDEFVSKLRDGLPLFDELAKAVRQNKQDPQLEKDLEQLGQQTRPFALEHGLKACLPDQN